MNFFGFMYECYVMIERYVAQVHLPLLLLGQCFSLLHLLFINLTTGTFTKQCTDLYTPKHIRHSFIPINTIKSIHQWTTNQKSYNIQSINTQYHFSFIIFSFFFSFYYKLSHRHNGSLWLSLQFPQKLSMCLLIFQAS